MTDFTRDCLRFCVRVGTDRPETFNIASRGNPDANIASLAAFALALLDRAEKAEAMVAKWEGEIGALMPEGFKDWHENAIEEHPMVAAWCLKSQRENSDHAWELLQKYIDLLDAAEAERDRLQRALDLSEQAHREVREVCERHGVENALGLSVRLESVCDERDRLRAQLDSILANSDSLESGRLADAHAENARLREELEEAEEAILVAPALFMRLDDEWCMSEWREKFPAVRRARQDGRRLGATTPPARR